MIKKILILTDSIGNPRSFPIDDITELEETYPYILRGHFPGAVFWQLSYGNITTEELFNQAIGYLSHWNPDVIIVHSGINDARPEAFSEWEKKTIVGLSGPFIKYIKQHLYNPKWIKRRNLYRVSSNQFKKTAKKLKLIFDSSQIYWIEICSEDSYERARPGVLERCTEFNQILYDCYQSDLIHVKKDILSVQGFHQDHLHWNKKGHHIVANILLNKIYELKGNGIEVVDEK